MNVQVCLLNKTKYYTIIFNFKFFIYFAYQPQFPLPLPLLFPTHPSFYAPPAPHTPIHASETGQPPMGSQQNLACQIETVSSPCIILYHLYWFLHKDVLQNPLYHEPNVGILIRPQLPSSARHRILKGTKTLSLVWGLYWQWEAATRTSLVMRA